MTRKSMGRATTAGLSIAAVAALGFGATPLAFSQDTEQCTANFNAEKKVKLTVNKREGNETEARDNGLANPAAPGTPLGGAEFTLTKVDGLDVSTNAGQQKIAALVTKYQNDPTKIFDEDGLSKGAATTQVTSSAETEEKGKAAFENLDPGMYLLEETKVPEGKDGKSYVGSKPVLVALPLTNPTERNCWNYDVQVYPKNSTTDVKKSVVDASTPGSGNETANDEPTKDGSKKNAPIQYTVSAALPKVETKRFRLIDPLDARLTYVDGSATVKVVDASGVEIPGNLLTSDDYELDYAPVKPAVEASESTNEQPKTGSYLTVTIKPESLSKLPGIAKDNEGARLQLQFNVKAPVTSGKTIIPNEALLQPDIPNDGSGDFDPKNPGPGTPPGTPTPKVETKYGVAEFKKVGEGDEAAKLLEGAVFKVYEVPNADKTCADDKLTADRLITVKGQSEWTTTTDGVESVITPGEKVSVVLDGLLVNDFRNNAPVEADNQTFYCLKETTAPADHELLPNAVPFQVLSTSPTFSHSENVVNVKKNNGFNLPLTGGAGIAPLVVVGGLLIAGSGAYVAAASRRKKQA